MQIVEEGLTSVFGVGFCLSGEQVGKLDRMASEGEDGEMRALCSVLRTAQKISAVPANDNGHNGHGKSKKPSKTPATARKSRTPVFYRA